MKLKRVLQMFLFIFAIIIMVGCTTTTYSLKVNYDKDLGTVTYTEPNQNMEYNKDTQIVLEVTPNEGSKVTKVSVDGQEVQLSNNTYTFSISKDTTIDVVFEKNQIQQNTYAVSVKGNSEMVTWRFEHKEEDVDENGHFYQNAKVKLVVEPLENYKVTSVKENNQEITLESGTFEFVVTSDIEFEITCEPIVKVLTEEALASVQTSLELNGIYHLYYTDSTDEEYYGLQTIFEETSVYQVELDYNSGEITYEVEFVNHNGYCSVPRLSLQNEVTYNDSTDLFADFDNPFKDLTVEDFAFVSDGKFELLNKKKEAAMCITGWNESIDKFYVTVENNKIVGIEIITQTIEAEGIPSYHSEYSFEISEHGTAQTGIQVKPYERVPEHDALEQAFAKVHNNYTVNHRDIWEGEEDIVYNVMVDEKGTYSDYVEEGSNVTYGYVELDGFVYQFSYDGQVVTVGDPYKEFSSIKDIQSDFSAFSVCLFEYVGNETYVARNAQLAALLVPYIGEDFDTQQLGNYATSLKVTLKDGVLYQVEFEYLVYGYKGTAVLTYSKFDETSIDIDFSNVVKVSILDDFIGVWSNSDHEIVITKEGITIDGTVYEVESYEEGIFTGYCGEELIFIQVWSSIELDVYDSEGTYLYTVELQKEHEKVEIPEEYKGVWASEEHRIVVQTNVIIVDGVEFVVTTLEEGAVLIGKYNDATHYLYLNTEVTPHELIFANSDLTESFAVVKTNETYIEIPESYVGTWKDADETMTVEITFMGIKINGIEYVIESYDEIYGFTGTYNGIKDYMVAPYYSADKIQIGTMDENYVCTKVNQGGSDQPGEVSVNPKHIGKYAGATEDGISYEIIVTENAITINGLEYALTAYDEYEGYTGLYQNEELYLMYVTYDGSNSMYLFNADYSLFVQCPIQTESSKVNPEHVGTYRGEKEGTTYEVVVSETKITVNGTEFVISEVTEFSEYLGTISGEGYSLAYQGAFGDLPASFSLVKDDYSLIVQCDKVE